MVVVRVAKRAANLAARNLRRVDIRVRSAIADAGNDLFETGRARIENNGEGDAAAALPELEEAMAMGEKSLPPEHPHLEEYRETLAKCRAGLAEQGKPDAKGGGG